MQIEGTKLIFIMTLSVLDFFKYGSRIPQIAQIKLVSTFRIFRGRVRGGGGGGEHALRPPPLPLEISSFLSH